MRKPLDFTRIANLLLNLLPYIIGYAFYCVVRWYLNKYKGYNLPLMFERYYDDLKRTYMQLLIFMIGIIIGYIILFIIVKTLSLV
jgi:hypothetical protein